jgi:drug/metabolite transporter (DMT)-like permease
MGIAETPAPAPSKASILLAFAAVYTLWGSTYLAIRFAIETLPPFLMAAVRFLIAGAIMYLWARARGAPRPTAREWRAGAIVGGLLLLGGNGAVVWAEQRVASGLTALLVATVPLWIVIAERKRPTLAVASGLLLGFGGLALLVWPWGSIDKVALGALIVGSLSWTAGSLYSRRAPLPKAPLMAIALELIGGGALLGVAAAISGARPHIPSTTSMVAVAYLVVFGSIIGFSCYVWLLQVVRPTLVATYAFVNPVVAVFLGWAIGHEPLSARTLSASAVIIAGVACITFRRVSRVPA